MKKKVKDFKECAKALDASEKVKVASLSFLKNDDELDEDCIGFVSPEKRGKALEVIEANKALKILHDKGKLYIGISFFETGAEKIKALILDIQTIKNNPNKSSKKSSNQSPSSASNNFDLYDGDELEFEKIFEISVIKGLEDYNPKGKLAVSHNVAAVLSLVGNNNFVGIAIELFPDIYKKGLSLDRMDLYDDSTKMIHFCPNNLKDFKREDIIISMPSIPEKPMNLLAHELAHAIDYIINRVDSAYKLILALENYSDDYQKYFKHSDDGQEYLKEVVKFAKEKFYDVDFKKNYKPEKVVLDFYDPPVRLGTPERENAHPQIGTPKDVVEQYKIWRTTDEPFSSHFSAVATEYLGFYAERISELFINRNLDKFQQVFTESLSEFDSCGQKKTTRTKKKSSEKKSTYEDSLDLEGLLKCLFALDVMDVCSKEYLNTLKGTIQSTIDTTQSMIDDMDNDMDELPDGSSQESLEELQNALQALNFVTSSVVTQNGELRKRWADIINSDIDEIKKELLDLEGKKKEAEKKVDGINKQIESTQLKRDADKLKVRLDKAEEEVTVITNKIEDIRAKADFFGIQLTQPNPDLERDMDASLTIDLSRSITDIDVKNAIKEGKFYNFYKLVLSRFVQVIHQDSDIISDPISIKAELFHYVNSDIDDNGNSILHLIAQAMSEDINPSIHQHHSAMILFLLSLGANPSLVNNLGSTPSELAQIPYISLENSANSAHHHHIGESSHQARHHNMHVHKISNPGVLAAHVENSVSMMHSDAIIPFWVYSYCMVSKAFKSAKDFLNEKCQSGILSMFSSYFGKHADSKKCDRDVLQSNESKILDIVFDTIDNNRQAWINNLDHLDQETAKWLGYIGCSEQGQIPDF